MNRRIRTSIAVLVLSAASFAATSAWAGEFRQPTDVPQQFSEVRTLGERTTEVLPGPHSGPTVACNDAGMCLYAWNHYDTILARRVDRSGTFVSVEPTELGDGVDPEVASDGDSFMVMWRSENQIRGRRIASDGTLPSTSSFQIGETKSKHSEFGITFGANQYLVAWFRGPGGFDPGRIVGSRIGTSGNVKDAGSPIVFSEISERGGFRQLELDFDGSNFHVAWLGRASNPGREVRFVRANASGTVLEPSPARAVTAGTNVRHLLGYACWDGACHVFWHDDQDVRETEVESDGSVPAPAGRSLVGLPSDTDAYAAGVSVGNQRIALVLDADDGRKQWVAGVRLKRDGTVLDSTLDEWMVGESVSVDPTVGYDGRNFRLGWVREVDIDRKTRIARIDPTTAGIRGTEQSLATAIAPQTPEAVEALDRQFLLAWSATDDPYAHGPTKARRIRPNGKKRGTSHIDMQDERFHEERLLSLTATDEHWIASGSGPELLWDHIRAFRLGKNGDFVSEPDAPWFDFKSEMAAQTQWPPNVFRTHFVDDTYLLTWFRPDFGFSQLRYDSTGSPLGSPIEEIASKESVGLDSRPSHFDNVCSGDVCAIVWAALSEDAESMPISMLRYEPGGDRLDASPVEIGDAASEITASPVAAAAGKGRILVALDKNDTIGLHSYPLRPNTGSEPTSSSWNTSQSRSVDLPRVIFTGREFFVAWSQTQSNETGRRDLAGFRVGMRAEPLHSTPMRIAGGTTFDQRLDLLDSNSEDAILVAWRRQLRDSWKQPRARYRTVDLRAGAGEDCEIDADCESGRCDAGGVCEKPMMSDTDTGTDTDVGDTGTGDTDMADTHDRGDTSPSPDTGTEETSSPDASSDAGSGESPSTSSGGCGCDQSGGGPSTPIWMALVWLGFLTIRRRR